jgi:hypothetical protein
MKKNLFMVSSIVSLCIAQIGEVMVFENDRTHRAMTIKAVERSVLAGGGHVSHIGPCVPPD